MLSFLLLASSSGQPLPDDAAARCSHLPTRELVFVPTASTTWRSDDGHVLLAAWSTDPRWWHVGAHGLTAVTGHPWSLDGDVDSPPGPAFVLTEKLGEGPRTTVPAALVADEVVVRLRADGSGLVAPLGPGGAVFAAEGDGLLAISDRAGLAAMGVGGAPRRVDAPHLVRGTAAAEHSGYAGVERLRPGGRILFEGRLGPKRVDDGPPHVDGEPGAQDELVASAVGEVTALVEAAARRPGDRWLELGPDPASLVLAAAVAAAGVGPRFRVRPRRHADAEAVEALARVLGVQLESAAGLDGGSEALDRRVRVTAGRTDGLIAPAAATGGRLGQVLDGAHLLLSSVPGGALAPATGATGRDLLTSQAWAAVDADDRAWQAGRGRVVEAEAARHVLAEVDRRSPARRAAARALAAGATLLDPTGGPAVTRLAIAAAMRQQDPVRLLVEALHPDLVTSATPGGDALPVPGPEAWRSLAPVVEANVLGHGREVLTGTVDLERVTDVIRSPVPPDQDTVQGLLGVLGLAVWAAELDVHQPWRAAPVEVRTPVETPAQVPTLVTGVTSTSLLQLASLSVPLAAQEDDALLGTAIDREVRDLVLRILLAAGATPGHLPEDIDARLSGPDTAGLAADARTLLARRGGTLADPRLALTLPFWHAHVATPRVVLVAERPPDLSRRSPARLPRRDLLAWWIDTVAAAAATGTDVHLVDPADLQDLGEQEASGWDGLGEDADDTPDLVRVARTVDSLVREIELDAARPLLRTIRRARAAQRQRVREVVPATAPLRVVDELWERAVAADRSAEDTAAALADAEARVTALTGELDAYRERRGWRAAWSVLVGRDD